MSMISRPYEPRGPFDAGAMGVYGPVGGPAVPSGTGVPGTRVEVVPNHVQSELGQVIVSILHAPPLYGAALADVRQGHLLFCSPNRTGAGTLPDLVSLTELNRRLRLFHRKYSDPGTTEAEQVELIRKTWSFAGVAMGRLGNSEEDRGRRGVLATSTMIRGPATALNIWSWDASKAAYSGGTHLYLVLRKGSPGCKPLQLRMDTAALAHYDTFRRVPTDEDRGNLRGAAPGDDDAPPADVDCWQWVPEAYVGVDPDEDKTLLPGQVLHVGYVHVPLASHASLAARTGCATRLVFADTPAWSEAAAGSVTQLRITLGRPRVNY